MGGSTLFQTLWEAYQTNLAQSATTEAAQILGGIAVTVQGALLLYIIILGKQMMFNALAFNAGVDRMIRAIIVMALMSAANYQTFVGTPITQTIPTFVSNLVTGSHGLAGAQGWDALVNQISQSSEQTLAQAVGIAYISDRIVIWLVTTLQVITVGLCFFFWLLAYAAVDLLMPLGAVLIPFYLFDATRQFAAGWYGKIVALFLVMMLTMMLGQIVVFQDAQYLQKFGQNIAAQQPAPGFNLNPDLETPVFAPTTGGGAGGATINIDSSIGTIIHAEVVMLFGLFLLAITTGMALGIGRSSGFSAAPALNTITRTGSAVIRGR
jgi:type IV secretory pathway VirB6-like protein